MSVKSRYTDTFFDEDVVHSVILEKTPSPPPKPPRGIMRKGAPMKPQRSAIKIEPVQNEDKENCSQSQPQQSQFKAKDMMDQMQSYFKRSIAVIRRSEEFTGTEAADILTAYIESHRNDFPRENVGRSNAVKLLEIWRQQKMIHCVDPAQKKFVDSERSFYRLGGENEQCLYIASPPSASGVYDESIPVSRSSSSRRSNSFKRLFSPLVRRNRSSSRGRDKDSTKDGSTLLKSTWSLFSSSDKQERKARRAEQQLIKEEEAEVYELALFHLLGLIEVEFLEDVALPVQDAKKNASFLSSIMEKVGLGSGERLDPQQEDDMDLLIETHPLIRDASQWFQMARCCAPTLYLQKSPEKSSKMQLFLWCKAALTAVSTRLEKMTQNGVYPLFPSEFAPLLTKIAQQLINDLNSGDKLSTAVMYIFLMVPHPLRKTIDQIVHWLQLTLRTDAVEDLRSPYYLGRTEPRHKENVKVIVEELRSFIFPKGCMNNAQQDIFIETLVELRITGRLGQRPSLLENSLRAKHSSAESELTPVRFTVARESLRAKAQKSKDGLSETESALVQMMEAVLDDKKISLTDKKKQLANFCKCYPALYKRFFKDML